MLQATKHKSQILMSLILIRTIIIFEPKGQKSKRATGRPVSTWSLSVRTRVYLLLHFFAQGKTRWCTCGLGSVSFLKFTQSCKVRLLHTANVGKVAQHQLSLLAAFQRAAVLRKEVKERKRMGKRELGQKIVFISPTISLYRLILQLISGYFRRQHRTKVKCPQREVAESTAVCKVKWPSHLHEESYCCDPTAASASCGA